MSNLNIDKIKKSNIYTLGKQSRDIDNDNIGRCAKGAYYRPIRKEEITHGEEGKEQKKQEE